MDPNPGPFKPALPSGLSLIERAQELKWTLQLAAAVLFADLVLAWRTGQGLARWSIQADQLLANSGFLLVAVLAFAVLMSIVIPLVAEFFRQLGWLVLTSVPWPGWMRTTPDFRRPAGGVLPGELRDHAYRTGDRSLLEMVDAHWRRVKQEHADRLAAGQMVFAVLVLGIVNYFPGLLGVQADTLLRDVPAVFGEPGGLALCLALLLALAAIKLTWFTDHQHEWIDYPPLYHDLENKRRELRRAGLAPPGAR
ncbi:hypothetical protein [Bordetella petrii]|uniref:hypothetical protein n=1 Tax=Bordetella petrii TaxID=94624 RepID=UPI00047D6589|nr:hypothetical protein [Bordetella petrii]